MNYKILVVDDESEIADLIEMYLQNENYTVYKSYTAQGALDYIADIEFDLAILYVTRNRWVSDMQENSRKIYLSCDYAYS